MTAVPNQVYGYNPCGPCCQSGCPGCPNGMAACWTFTVTGNPNPYNGTFCLVQLAGCTFVDKCTNLWTLKVAGGGTTLTSSAGAIYTLSESFNCNGLNSFALTTSPSGSTWQQTLTLSPGNCNAYPCYPNCRQPGNASCCTTQVPLMLTATMFAATCICPGAVSVPLTYDPTTQLYTSPVTPGFCGNMPAFYFRAACASGGGFIVGIYNAATSAVLASGPLSCQGCANLSFTVDYVRESVTVSVVIAVAGISVFPTGPYDSNCLIPCAVNCQPFSGAQSSTGQYVGTFNYQAIGPNVSACAPGFAGQEVIFQFACDFESMPASIQFLAGLGGITSGGNNLCGWLWSQQVLGSDTCQFVLNLDFSAGFPCIYSCCPAANQNFGVVNFLLGSAPIWVTKSCPTMSISIGGQAGRAGAGFANCGQAQYGFQTTPIACTPTTGQNILFVAGQIACNYLGGCLFNGPGAFPQRSFSDILVLVVVPP